MILPGSVSLEADGPRSTLRYTRAELLADGTIHLLGTSAALAACVALLALAVRSDNLLAGLALGPYLTGLVAMFGFSALYNLATEGRWKSRLRRLDHASIFMMIAGTYTPVVIFAIPGTRGWSLLAVVWAGAVAGATLKLLAGRRFERVSVVAYLMLGWAGVTALGPLLDALPTRDMVLLAAGGLLYSTGVVMHLATRLRYHNALWHMFVLGAAGCHFAAVYRLAAGSSA